MIKYLTVIMTLFLISCSDCQGCGNEIDATPQNNEPDACADAGVDGGTDTEAGDASFTAIYETVCEATRLKAF
jgi:hypothetical protein